MAEAIVAPQLIDQVYAALEASNERDEQLEQAFDESALSRRICIELATFEGQHTRAAILTLCKMMFRLGWTTAHIARQAAWVGGVQ